jgi:hypothetical protein
MTILNIDYTGGLAGRLLDRRLHHRLDRRRNGGIKRRNGKQGT